MSDHTTDDIQHVPATTPNFQTELAEKLRDLAPEAVTDGKIDVQKLNELLSSDTADASERFGLFWPGKKRAIRAAQDPTTATLKPAKDQSVDWDTTQNVFVEGDNLEVLKILQKHYHNKVKVIYIDPPYNTGKDFVYPDNYKEGLVSYLEFTKQLDETGRRVSTNSDTDGRYHSNWLNMMYPRLKLARNLLTDDGVVFISIDDNEEPHLRKLCDEIFGEDKFIEAFIWQKKTQPSFLSKEVAEITEYILAYKRSSDQRPLKGGETDMTRTSEMINIGNPVGERVLPKEIIQIENGKFTGELQAGEYGNGVLTVTLLENVQVTDGIPASDMKIKSRIVQSQATIDAGAQSGWTIFIKRTDSLRPTIDKNRSEAGIRPPISLLSKKLDVNIPTNTDASNEIKALFDGVNIMDYPKPSKLMKFLIEAATFDDPNALILDFFSGSGTTAHAVMQLNAEDGGNRTHIQVQLPEPTDPESEAYKAGYRTISAIARERINRAATKIKADHSQTLATRSTPLDVGYRAYTLVDTNFTKWRGSSATDTDSLQQHLLSLRDSSNDAASEEELLTEVLLKQGASLSALTTHTDIAGLSVWTAADTLAYLNEQQKPTLDQLRAVTASKPSKFIILEDAFQGDDELKTNLVQLCKTNNVELWTV